MKGPVSFAFLCTYLQLQSLRQGRGEPSQFLIIMPKWIFQILVLGELLMLLMLKSATHVALVDTSQDSFHVHTPRTYTYLTYMHSWIPELQKKMHPLEQMRKNAPLLPNKDPQKSKNVYLISPCIKQRSWFSLHCTVWDCRIAPSNGFWQHRQEINLLQSFDRAREILMDFIIY